MSIKKINKKVVISITTLVLIAGCTIGATLKFSGIKNYVFKGTSNTQQSEKNNSSTTVASGAKEHSSTNISTKTTTSPRLTVTQKAEVKNKVGGAIDNLNSALNSTKDVPDVDMNTINSIN